MKTYAPQIFRAALFITAERGKQFKCPLTDDWMNKIRPSQTIDYYLAMKTEH